MAKNDKAASRKCVTCFFYIPPGLDDAFCMSVNTTCITARGFGRLCGPEGKHWVSNQPIPPDMAQLPEDTPERAAPGAAPIIGVDVGSYGQPTHPDWDEDAPLINPGKINRRHAAKITVRLIAAAALAYAAWESIKLAIAGY